MAKRNLKKIIAVKTKRLKRKKPLCIVKDELMTAIDAVDKGLREIAIELKRKFPKKSD